MLQNIGVSLCVCSLLCLCVELPDNIASQVLNLVVSAVPRTLGTLDELAYIVATTINLTAHRVEVDTILHLEVD